ncbi:hypothetical protein F383_12397 [Gossypium arboreum]|uniref:Uncharacterized protein n=1 Tax=Gossypium arboreum TaxID=29729 RepID=A0A0B0PW95_GOSAR|nr:hypothetical protein F383_12397 [Gossypium arboreum]
MELDRGKPKVVE